MDTQVGINDKFRDSSYEWVNYIHAKTKDDVIGLELFPLQFANVERLRANDAVFLFDEVGTGKTISSGLMALDYLYNNRMDATKRSVHVITINTLVKAGEEEYGQFLRDWFTKLPFGELGLQNDVTISNNHEANLDRKRHVGLLILDEVHLLLNEDTQRVQNILRNIRADKVVFLTATPIKESLADLEHYQKLAKQITQKDIGIRLADYLFVDQENIICQQFDEKIPVTRYFKHTVQSINEKTFDQNYSAKRATPIIWMGDDKIATMYQHIRELSVQNPTNHFVIFTRRIDLEAEQIKKYFLDQGWPLQDIKVITGENSFEVSKYTLQREDLPVVLIMTYQIAEQGVNLPGYNYVVNYHIPKFPASLEQRFGRVDRMGSKHDAIYMVYLLRESFCDKNKLNFIQAIGTYTRTLLSILPSKNTILSADILEQYRHILQDVDLLELQMNYIKTNLSTCVRYLLGQESVMLIKVCDYLKERLQEASNEWEEMDQVAPWNRMKLLEEERSEEKRCERWLLEQLEKDRVHRLEEEQIQKASAIIRDMDSNKIFYSLNPNEAKEIKTLDAVKDCAKTIFENKKFRAYQEWFEKQIEKMQLIASYRKDVNKVIENMFWCNDMEVLFPLEGDFDAYGMEQILKRFLQGEKESDRNKLLSCKEGEISSALILKKVLPFYRMCDKFGELLKNEMWTQQGTVKEKFDYNPFYHAIRKLGRYIRSNPDLCGLSEQFVDRYWPQDLEQKKTVTDYLYYEKDRTYNRLRASNWFRLIYHMTRREEVYFDENDVWHMSSIREDNLYRTREKSVMQCANEYMQCQNDVGDYDEGKWRQISGEKGFDFYQNCFPKMPYAGLTMSLFEYFVFAQNPNRYEADHRIEGKDRYDVMRKHVADSVLVRNCKSDEDGGNEDLFDLPVGKDDIWTLGILTDLYGNRYELPTWNEIFKARALRAHALIPKRELPKLPTPNGYGEIKYWEAYL